VAVIPNGVDAEHFKPLSRNNVLAESLGLTKEGNIAETSRVIGFTGELREKKGLQALLIAYARVNTKQAATLLIVGDVRTGVDKQVFEEFKHSNPTARIVVTGFVPSHDLPSYYSLMDLFVHPSMRDGLPNALLEAMACERAVIGTNIGGIIDAVKDSENGRLIPAKDIDELANTMEELLSDNQLRMKLGSAARQTVIENFTLQEELNGNLTVYRRLGLKT
jgi:glycosyltransferase involved in cell wall biosynthesis